MTTENDLVWSALLAGKVPLLVEGARAIADPQVRYMGTVGGNVANGDPGNDMPGLMQCLDAHFTLVGPDGSREVSARDFYPSAYFPALVEVYAALDVRVRPVRHLHPRVFGADPGFGRVQRGAVPTGA